MKDEDSVSISIPKKLFERICQEINNTNPKAVSKYITYILNKELATQQKRVSSEEDKNRVKEKLRGLGYF